MASRPTNGPTGTPSNDISRRVRTRPASGCRPRAHRLVETLHVLGQHQALSTGTRTASHDVARPSASHSTRTPSIRTPPSAGRKRTAIPVRMRSMASVGLHADHRVVRPGHARVGDRGRPAGEHARVVRLDVRVRADHRGHASVQQAGHRDLLARRLGVEVDEDDRRRAARLLDQVVDDLERAVRRREEEPAEQVEDGDRRAVGGRLHVRPVRAPFRERFAGRITRSDCARYGPISMRRQTWLPSVTTSAPAARSLSAILASVPLRRPRSRRSRRRSRPRAPP